MNLLLEKNQDRTVEIYIPIDENSYTKIYPFCTGASKTGMYGNNASIGFDIEQSWRGFKHWDRLQTGIRFRGEYNSYTNYTTNTMMFTTTKKED